MVHEIFIALGIVALMSVSAAPPLNSGRSGQNEPQGGRVAETANDIHPILVGMKIPDVLLTAVDGQPVRLSSLLEKGPIVLVFYRGGWCPYCNLQLEQLHTVEDDVLELGYQIVAISADRPENAEQSVEKHNLHYTLLSDSAKTAAKVFGLAYKVDEKTLEASKTFGITLEAASGLNDHVLPVPAVFVVQKDGSIIFEYVNPNFKVRLNARVLLAILKAENEETKTGSKEREPSGTK